MKAKNNNKNLIVSDGCCVQYGNTLALDNVNFSVSKGKRVAVPNLTMIATINSIIWAGAIPVLVDVDETLCMSLKSLKKLKNLERVKKL